MEMNKIRTTLGKSDNGIIEAPVYSGSGMKDDCYNVLCASCGESYCSCCNRGCPKCGSRQLIVRTYGISRSKIEEAILAKYAKDNYFRVLYLGSQENFEAATNPGNCDLCGREVHYGYCYEVYWTKQLKPLEKPAKEGVWLKKNHKLHALICFTCDEQHAEFPIESEQISDPL
jgi:hypothetical protein